MKVLIRKELRLSRNLLMIWMGLVLLLGIFTYFEYLSMEDSLEELLVIMNAYPRILMIIFGIGEGLDSVLSWYGCIYFWVTILSYSYAVYLGLSCVAKEKKQGTAEYLFTKPVRRRQIVMAKAAAGICNLFILATFCGLSNYLSFVLPLGGLEEKGIITATTTGMFFTEVILFSLGLLISSLAKTYKYAARWGAGMLLGFYGLYVIAEYSEIPALYYLTPLKYFDVYAVARNGFSASSLLISTVIVTYCVVTSQKNWTNREL